MAWSSGGMLPVFTEVIERTMDYQVRSGDTVLGIAGRFGADWQAVAQANGLRNPDRIYPGQRLMVEMRRIVPGLLEHGVIINVPEAMLYYFENGRVVFYAGVGLGKPGRWRTPTGPFVVRTKERHPTWEVPLSIQQEMEAEGRVVLTRVPPGPENPLGEFWLGLSIPGYGIHGTIAPASIGHYQSHGCIRMHPDDIRRLFALVAVGTPGALVYHPVKVAREESRVSVEAHPDVYGFNRPRLREVEAALRALDVPLDWNRVSQILTKPNRMAERVSLEAALGRQVRKKDHLA
ncbi:MAG: L,D-transpeptidase family protein [Nitrospira sp.]|nr:L,D-transpeptidase family protein [Nitrospira sp.]